MIFHSLFAAVSGVSAVTVSDQVAHYDVESNCRSSVGQMAARLETCIQAEQDARAKLAAEWIQFPVADRIDCLKELSVGGSASYAELLVCLRTKAEVREIHRNNFE